MKPTEFTAESNSPRRGVKLMNESANNPPDVISVDVPLLIRIMEYAKEDANTDMDLHRVAENMIRMSEGSGVLTMQDYDSIVGDSVDEHGKDGMNRPKKEPTIEDASSGASCAGAMAAGPAGSLFGPVKTKVIKRSSVGQGIYLAKKGRK